MYPHLYDFLQEMEKYFEIIYWGDDQRGYEYIPFVERYNFFRKKPFNLWRLLGMIKYLSRIYYRSLQRLQTLKQAIRPDLFAVIAIDHTALNNAARYVKGPAKLIYWSHDAIPPDWQWYCYYFIPRIVHHNKTAIQRYQLIIVQDYYRGAILDAMLGSHNLPKFFLPVSLADDEHAQCVAREKAHTPPQGKVRVMQLMFNQFLRGSHLLLQAYQQIEDRMQLFFQGIPPANIEELTRHCTQKPVFFPVQKTLTAMRKNVSQMDIGVVSYLTKDLNHLFLSNASGQLVEFIRLGIPVITFGNYELGEFVTRYRIGVPLDDMGHLYNAISHLINNYPEYAANARALYEEKYMIMGYCQALAERLLTV